MARGLQAQEAQAKAAERAAKLKKQVGGLAPFLALIEIPVDSH